MPNTPPEDVGRQTVQRAPLADALAAVEAGALAEIEHVRESLAGAIEAVTRADAALAAETAARAEELKRRYAEEHEQLLALMARQAPVASDLRLAIALVHVNDRVRRMGAQCVNILTLRDAFPEGEQPSVDQLECLGAMAALADAQMDEAARVFAERDEDGAARLTRDDREINEHNRRCFALAVRDGDSEARREVGFLVALMARAVERIGDNAVDIGHQAAFAAIGRLPE